MNIRQHPDSLGGTEYIPAVKAELGGWTALLLLPTPRDSGYDRGTASTSTMIGARDDEDLRRRRRSRKKAPRATAARNRTPPTTPPTVAVVLFDDLPVLVVDDPEGGAGSVSSYLESKSRISETW
jgi:hypothetical protein